MYNRNKVFIKQVNDDQYPHQKIDQARFISKQLLPNFTSFAGMGVLFDRYPIYKEEFVEIYPLLSAKILKLVEQKKFNEADFNIKLRSFAFITLCYVLKNIPNLIKDVSL